MILVMSRALAYAAFDKTAPFGPFNVDRREPGPRDVQIDILFCGVCHSDLHTARSEWPGTIYPCVPGHEIAGRVASVGSAVTGFKAGALAAVGCMVDSCMACASCLAGLQQVLRQRRHHVHLQRAGQEAAGRDHLRRLLQPDRRRRAVLPAPAGDARPCRRRAAALRWDHDILAVEALGRRQGEEGRDRRPRRPWPYGGEALARLRRPHGAVHDIAGEDRGREAPWRGPGRRLEGRRRDAGARGKLRFDPEHGGGVARPRRLHGAAEARRHDGPPRRAGTAASLAGQSAT